MSGSRAVLLLKRSSNQHTVNACPKPQIYSKHTRGLRLADKCDPEVDDTGGVWVVGRISKEVVKKAMSEEWRIVQSRYECMRGHETARERGHVVRQLSGSGIRG
jgi:hypothetical protein